MFVKLLTAIANPLQNCRGTGVEWLTHTHLSEEEEGDAAWLRLMASLNTVLETTKSKSDAQNNVNLTKDYSQRGKEIKIDISSHPQLQRNQKVLLQA